MGSLLRSADERRKKRKRIEGVSTADQEEIRREIARVAERNRLDITPELLAVNQGRRGVLFPLIVNAAAVLVVVGGIVAFSAFFDPSSAAARAAEISALEGAEGTVVSELQQQMQAEIEQRDDEIAAIERRLAEIDRERGDFEAEIVQREVERREQLERELDAALSDERGRLEAIGLGIEEIELRLAEYETTRSAEIDHELAAYAEELQSERDRLIVELAGLESQLEDDLDELTDERERMEQEMIAAQRAADEELQSALTEMAELETQARRRDQIDAQVLGLFEALRDATISEDHDAAHEEAENLRALLNEPQVRAVRGETRRKVDLFVVDQLEAMIALEAQDGPLQPVDELREEILDLVARGDTALDREDEQTAEAYYREALALMPQLFAGHRFLLERAVEQDLSAQASELKEQAAEETAELEHEIETTVATLERLQRESAEEIAALQQELQETVAALAQLRTGSAEQISALERQLAAREAELSAELENAREAAAAAEAFVEASAEDTVDPGELKQLREAAERLAEIEQRYESFQRERPEELAPAGSAQLLSARRLLHDVLSSTEFESVLPGLARDVERYHDAHFDAGREDAFAETVDVLYGVTTFSSNRERREYLERVLRAGNIEPAFREFLEQLAGLLQDEHTALR